MLKRVGLFAVAAMLVLAGCSTVGKVITGSVKNPVTPLVVYDLRAGYDAAFLVPAAAYNKLPRCSHAPAPCSEQSIVNQLRSANAKVQLTLGKLTTFALAHDTINASAAYDIAVAAIAAAEKLGASHDIGS